MLQTAKEIIIKVCALFCLKLLNKTFSFPFHFVLPHTVNRQNNKKQKGAWMLPAWLILHVVNRNATETVHAGVVSRGLIKHARG